MKCINCGYDLQNVKGRFCPKCGTKISVAESNDPVNAVWPEWKTEKELGRGAYGTVYQAIRDDSNIITRSAIKVISIPSDHSEIDSLISEGMDDDSTRKYFKGIVEDFVGEIRLMESIKGIQNIVSVEDYKVVEKRGDIGWDIYIRMELLTSFNSYLKTNKLTESDVIKLGVDICSALEICNQRNIVHRDIKTENIFVNEFGYFKLGDFGIARKLDSFNMSLSQKGTYSYMAPEVAKGEKYDSRVDIYSLGIVLYRLLNNNRLPFVDTETQALSYSERKRAIDRRLAGESLKPPVNASPVLADVILRACSFEAENRYSSAKEFKEALLLAKEGKSEEIVTVQDSFDNVDESNTERTIISNNIPEPSLSNPSVTLTDYSEEKDHKRSVVIGIVAFLLIIASGVLIFFLFLPEKVSYEIGDTVELGIYEQDGNLSNGQEPIEWIVLDEKDDNYLLLSKYALDSKPFNDEAEGVTWSDCSLRTWLNDIFYRTAFGHSSRINNTYIDLQNNTVPDVENSYLSEFYTSDKVFLLSSDEVNKYFKNTHNSNIDSCKAEPTRYAVRNGVFESDNGSCGWWLRGNFAVSESAPRVNINGEILYDMSSEGGVERTDYAVRPAIWVDFSDTYN